jgi:hypothetical protein
MARKLASASSSEMFCAMPKPSHQTVVAGIVPPPTVGAAAKTVFWRDLGQGLLAGEARGARAPHVDDPDPALLVERRQGVAVEGG